MRLPNEFDELSEVCDKYLFEKDSEKTNQLNTKQVRLTYTPKYYIFMDEKLNFEKLILIEISSVLRNNLDCVPLKIEVKKVKADNTTFADNLSHPTGYYFYYKKDKIEHWTGSEVLKWLDERRFTYLIDCEVEVDG